jgi:hypothetical protein
LLGGFNNGAYSFYANGLAHSSLEKISGIVHHHWKEIEKSETLAKLFLEPPIVAFRQPKSIKDTLVRAAVSRPSSDGKSEQGEPVC